MNAFNSQSANMLLTYFFKLTTGCDNKALKDTHRVSQDEITKKLVAYTDGAGKNCLPKISNGKIHQDPVQGVTEFLELCCGHQDKTVGED